MTLIKNPKVIIDFTSNDCLITLNENEFLIEFKTEEYSKIISNLLNGIKNNSSLEEKQLLDFFIQQKILFLIPKFLLQ